MSRSQITAPAISMNSPTHPPTPETHHTSGPLLSPTLIRTFGSGDTFEPLKTANPEHVFALPTFFPDLYDLQLKPNQLLNSAAAIILLYAVLSRGYRAILRDIADLMFWCLKMSSRVLSHLHLGIFGSSRDSPLKSVLGIERSNLVRTLPGTFGQQRLSSLLKGSRPNNPPGLGNWDNSCYQNSVIQGLAALSYLSDYLKSIAEASKEAPSNGNTMNGALLETTGQLNSGLGAGQTIWLPTTLKTMSTWQQQDAQEYFSKILDQLDKESLIAARTLKRLKGLAISSEDENESSHFAAENALKSPLEGLIAQRVGCLQCGFSEGLSFIPFNCLTVPLGSRRAYDIRECLDEYSTLERIDGVECPKCTLLHTKAQLEKLLAGALTEGFGKSIVERLQNIDEALQNEDFSDSTLIKKCVIPKKSWKSSTKSKQTVVGRAPTNLVIHVNRSLFNEFTGAQMKNYADVRAPLHLDLGPWCVGQVSPHDASESPLETWESDPRKSMLPPPGTPITSPWRYELRASIMHYGRHENGHYVCFRKYPAQAQSQEGDDQHIDPKQFNGWWRLSDESVSQSSEERLLNEGEVFMLFYERIDSLGYDAIEAPSVPIDWAATQEIATQIPLPADEPLDFSEKNDSSTSPPGELEQQDPAQIIVQPPVIDEDVSTPALTTDDSELDETCDDDGVRSVVTAHTNNIAMSSSPNTKKHMLMRTAGISGSRDSDELLNGLRMVSAV